MSEQEVKDIEDVAELPFSTEELALLLEMPVEQLRAEIQHGTTPRGRAITRARLRTKAEYYRAVIKLSNQGSGPAQQLLNHFLSRADT